MMPNARTHFRRFLARSACVLLSIILAAPSAFAADAPAEDASRRLELALDRGLLFLQRQQKPDGSFDAVGPHNAMAGLAILAYLSAGHAPDAGKYGQTVRNALDFLVWQHPQGGYFGRDGGRMYSHCIVTVALAQAYGMESDSIQRDSIRAALDGALGALAAAQDAAKENDALGGWRYEPDSADSDLAVTTWCLLALHACRDAGLLVPQDRIDRAIAYLLTCYRPDEMGFAYTPRDRTSASMTAAALLVLHLHGLADRPEAGAVARYLVDHPVNADTRYWYYVTYYVTHAAQQLGDPAWPALWKRASDELLALQRKDDGSWPAKRDELGGSGTGARFYPTAMACLTLATPQRLLPMYQR